MNHLNMRWLLNSTTGYCSRFIKKMKKLLLAVLIIGSMFSSCVHTKEEVLTIQISSYAKASDVPQGLNFPTHIGFFNGLEIVSDAHNNRFAYRPQGSTSKFSISPVAVKDQHSLTWCNGTYYAVNTNEHEVIEFTDIINDNGSAVANYSGISLDRPHDIVYNATDGFVYTIDNNKGLTRFKPRTSSAAEVSNVVSILDYARSLSIVDGVVYIINSSKGEVIQMRDFNNWTVYKSHGKKLVSPAGAWDRTGLVLNDVERYGDYWYGSNFFTSSYAQGHDHNKYRLIRWRTWEDFQNGNWEDLSNLLPKDVVPYYFTVNNGSLYLCTARAENPGINDIIYKLHLK